jgi:hypothetical protein
MKKSILAFILLLSSLWSVTAAGETNIFTFVPEQSTVVQTGGIAGIHETYSVVGQFQLTVDYDAGNASFDRVDANLTKGSTWLYTRDLGVLFNMTELAGTVLNDTTIEFEGRTADGTNVEVHIIVTLTGNSARLIGETRPPCCDFFIYHLDAVAIAHPATYYVHAVNGDDNNDGLSPETPFATIQKGIDTVEDGDTIIVYPGRYTESINFLGKNITLTSTEPTSSDIVNRTTIIDGSVWLRGTEDPNCTLTGFNINGIIAGFDRLIDPNGENHTHATISHCVLENITSGCGRVIWACDGTISNCVIANTSYMCLRPSPVPAIVGCHGLIKNCTMANMSDGIEILEGGICTIENCIIYRSSPIIVANGATLNISYCDLQGGLDWIWGGGTVNWGPGNIDADPRFARLGSWQVKGDYHLKSQAGRWDPNQNIWVYDANTSPCIDAGNPGCPFGDEPAPNGNRINMGAYGGTAEASKSPANWRSIADLTNDWTLDFNDLKVFVDYWLETGQCIPSDLNRSQFVDFFDFASLALDWEQTKNRAPVADAGPDITVLVNGYGSSCCVCLDIHPAGLVTMDGSDSYDPDGDTLTFTWGAPIPWLLYGIGCYDDVVEAANPTGEFPIGSTTVSLTVSDGELSDTDSLVVTVLSP